MIKLALENKYDILNFRKTMEIAEVNSRIVAAVNKPTVVAFGNYILTSGFDAESGKDKYWGQGSWTDTLTVAAAVQVPLSPLLPWSKERADVAKDKLDYEQMKLNLTTIESGVRLNIENLLLKIEEEKAKIHSREKSKELLSRLYRTTREGYTRGLVSNLELRDVETNLNNAALGYNLAVYNYTVAVILLYDAIGVDQQ
jgi:outer membrane protein TolC